MSYIEKKNALILAVTPATTDLATSDAIRLASDVDPHRQRTIGVITKLDMLDRGINPQDVLEHKDFYFKRGCVGVVNRSQMDITKNISIEQALEAERNFFNSNPSYSQIINRMGTAFLQTLLNQQLSKHIFDTLPSLRNKLEERKRSLEKEVQQFNNLDDPSKKADVLMSILRELQTNFDSELGATDGQLVDLEDLSGGANINEYFHDTLSQSIDQLEIDDEQLVNKISVGMKNIDGVRVGLFIPTMAFETVVRGEIMKLERPCLECVHLVTEELRKTLRKCTQKIKGFPKLNEEIERIVGEHISERGKEAEGLISSLIRIEVSYINSRHEDFVGLSNEEIISDGRYDKESSCSLYSGEHRSSDSNINQGMITIKEKDRNREYFFVLTSRSLVCYKDKRQIELRKELTLERMQMEVSMKKKKKFVLSYEDNSNIYEEQKSLELTCATEADAKMWEASLLQAGVPLKGTVVASGSQAEFSDKEPYRKNRLKANSALTDKAKIVHSLVESYMKIVHKTFKDLVPKIIMHTEIDNVKEFMKHNLLISTYNTDMMEKLLEVSDEGRKRRHDVSNLYNACKRALIEIEMLSAEQHSSTSIPDSRFSSNPVPAIRAQKPARLPLPPRPR